MKIGNLYHLRYKKDLVDQMEDVIEHFVENTEKPAFEKGDDGIGHYECHGYCGFDSIPVLNLIDTPEAFVFIHYFYKSEIEEINAIVHSVFMDNKNYRTEEVDEFWTEYGLEYEITTCEFPNSYKFVIVRFYWEVA